MVLAFTVIAWWLMPDPIMVADAGPPEVPDIYQVQPGDTLWVIARTHYPEQDPRRMVWEIQQLNGMDNPTIYPNQILKLPKLPK